MRVKVGRVTMRRRVRVRIRMGRVTVRARVKEMAAEKLLLLLIIARYLPYHVKST